MPFSLENQLLSRLNLPEMGKKKSLTVGLAIDLIGPAEEPISIARQLIPASISC
jgi:hypothetical protein